MKAKGIINEGRGILMVKRMDNVHRRVNMKMIVFIILFVIYNHNGVSGEETGVMKKRIAVMNFAPNNTSEGTARIVRNNMEVNLFRDGSFEMLEQHHVKEVLEERQFQVNECRDEECISRMGKILKADYIIIGSVDKLDNFTISAKVIDVKEGKIIITESRDADELKDIRRAAEELTGRVADRIRNIGKKYLFEHPLFITANIYYSFPFGYLGDIADYGYGMSIGARMEDLFVKNFLAGFELQFIYLDGRQTMRRGVLIPVTAQFGYAMALWKLSIIPYVSAGGCYSIKYYYNDYLKISQHVRSGFQPMLKAGAAVELPISSYNVYLRSGAEYGIIFEKDGDISLVSCFAGIGIKI
jgi:hypothetical protein